MFVIISVKYIHFTDEKGAEGILDTGEIWASSIAPKVYAIPVGGAYVPKVQATELGRAENRDLAVVFTTKELPDGCHPEECVWDTKRLKVNVVDVLDREDAAKMLDRSLPEDPDAPPWSKNTLLVPTKDNPEPVAETIQQIVREVFCEIL